MSWYLNNAMIKDTNTIHHYYMSIINACSDVIYWVDVNCHLMGCNQHFINLLGLEPTDFNGTTTPYLLMKTLGKWHNERIDALTLDDMNVIFSGEALYDVEEEGIIDKEGHVLRFRSTRIPLYDEKRNIIGLIVVLTTSAVTEKAVVKPEPKKVKRQARHLPSVLMVEDNIIAQNVERALLTALNCRVDVAATGDQALALFGPGKYDLVLMDIGLEGTSGYVVAKELRQLEKDTDYQVPIIALTGFKADIVKFDCKQYFMEGAITKPLTRLQAEQIIDHYILHLDTPVQGLKSA